MTLLASPWLWFSCAVLALAMNYYLSAYVLGSVLASCVALVLALMGAAGIWCLAGFLITALVVTPIHAQWLSRQKACKTQPLSQDRTPGSELIDHAITLKHDLPYGTGRVQIGDRLWKVRSDGNLQAGAEVRVTDIDGDTLLIQEKRLHDSGVMSD